MHAKSCLFARIVEGENIAISGNYGENSELNVQGGSGEGDGLAEITILPELPSIVTATGWIWRSSTKIIYFNELLNFLAFEFGFGH
jgi:hypothetical protein